MASCSQVSSLLQAYIDEELGNAEKCILEQHLAECSACRDELCEQKACSDQIMDVLAGQRLQWGIRSRVLAHLPEMDPAPNHGSHPTDPQYARKRQRSLAFPRALMAAAALLVVAGVTYFNQKEPLPPSLFPVAGMVTFCDGEGVDYKAGDENDWNKATLKSVVRGNEQFRTQDDSRLAISLIGHSIVKANYNSSITIHDNRRVLVDRGLTYFDVGHDSRRFDVETPNGNIVVVGTAFVVGVDVESTKVTVTEGAIVVSNDQGRTSVGEGQQLVFRKGEPLARPYEVDVKKVAAWAYAIVPDPQALALFEQTLEKSQAQVVPNSDEPFHMVWNLKDSRVDEIQLNWKSDGKTSGHCAYFVKVFDQDRKLRHVDFLDSKHFNDGSTTKASLKFRDGPLTGVDELQIQLIPDSKDGPIRTEITVSVVLTKPTPDLK